MPSSPTPGVPVSLLVLLLAPGIVIGAVELLLRRLARRAIPHGASEDERVAWRPS